MLAPVLCYNIRQKWGDTTVNCFSLLAVSVFYVDLVIGIFVLRLDSRSRTHRLFFVMALSEGLWNFFSAFLYAASTQGELWFWFRLAATFGTIFIPLILHFTLSITGRKRSWWLLVLVYAPSALVVVRSWTGTYIFKAIVRRGNGVLFYPATGSFWMYFWLVYSHLLTITALWLLFRWRRRARSLRERKQAAIVFRSLLIYALVASSFDYVFSPLLGVTSISPMLFLLFLFGTSCAIVRYRLFSITHNSVCRDIIANMEAAVILIDRTLKVVKVNRRGETLIGRAEKEVIGADILSVLGPNPLLEEELEKLLEEVEERSSLITLLELGDGKVSVEIELANVRDRMGEILGIVLMGKRIEGPKKFMARYGITGREWETILQVAAGLTNRAIARQLEITERTVKAHITHIFSKLDVRNRTQLLAALRDQHVLPGMAVQIAERSQAGESSGSRPLLRR